MKNCSAIAFVIFLFFAASCRQGREGVAQPGEGTITYKVSYPDSSHYGLKSSFFPKQIILVFKGEQATFVAPAAMGMVQLVQLLDHRKRTFTSLLIDAFRGNYGCKLTPEEIAMNESLPKLKFELTEETKTIAGLPCKRAIVRDETNQTTSELYYYENIRFYYWNSPFKELNYLFLEYTHNINNLTMKLEATNVDLKTPVDTTAFSIRGNYTWLNQKDFYNYLGKL